MSKKRLFGSKGPLIYATIVSLICVMSASISTFAWFQAEARVRIETSSESATITVSKPADADIATVQHWYYTGNYAGDENIGYSGSPSWSWANFALVSSKVGSTSSISLWPGRKLTYAISFQTSNASNIYLTLGSADFTAGVSASILLTSNSSNYQAGHTQVVMADAIDIYTCLQSSSTALSSSIPNHSSFSGDAFDFATYGQTKYDLLNQSGTNLTYCRIFYTIKFSNEPETLYTEYKELTGTNALGAEEPGAIRFFKQDPTNGDSNAYQYLSFGITNLTVGAA